MELAAQIRIMRAVRGLSQLELAGLTGIPNTYISLIEQGKMLPTGEWEQAIKSALQWPPHAQTAFELLIAMPQEQPATA